MSRKENYFVKIWNINQSQSYQIVMISKSFKKERERKENRYLNTWVLWMLKFTSFHIFKDEYDKMIPAQMKS